MTTTTTTPAIDLAAALASPESCAACHRKVSARALDTERAGWIVVQGYHLVLGPECRKAFGA